MSTSTMRTKDQLAVLLKLVEVNKIGLTRKNASIRQRIWQVITQKLNEMQGAEKDLEGWKRSYNAWRSSTGKYFEKERDRIIKDVADDDYFIINVSEEELISELNYDDEGDADAATYLDPKDRQLARLHELVSKQRLLIISNSADDEPLKQRLWQNIADELNSITDGVQLSKEEWEKRVDLRQYAPRRGRKKKNGTSSTKSHTSSNLGNNKNKNRTKSCDSYGSAYEEYIIEECHTMDKSSSVDETTNQCDLTLNNDVFAEIDENYDNNTDNIIKLLNEQPTHHIADHFPFDLVGADDVEGDDCNFESNNADTTEYDKSKRRKLTPIVKSFKFSNRMTTAVEHLNDNVKETKDLLQQTRNLLNHMCSVMEERNKKQDETNALLKRNGQLLRVLVEYKCGMREKIKN